MIRINSAYIFLTRVNGCVGFASLCTCIDNPPFQVIFLGVAKSLRCSYGPESVEGPGCI